MSAEIYGKDVVVKYRPSADGRQLEEKLTIRELPLSQMSKYIDASEDACKLAALLMGRDVNWVDTLSIDSVEEIVRVGEELNRSFFSRWVGMQRGVKEGILGALNRVTGHSQAG